MARIPPPLHDTVRRIYRLHEERRAAEPPRAYLGMSELGEACARRLWYGWRWCGGESFGGRMLRLFESGNREEARLIDELRAIGLTFEGAQFAVEACDGHVKGHLDGALLGLHEAPKTWHVFECKTHNAKSFAEIKAKGVRDAKPRHYAQLQLYMGATGMERAAYFAVCKDTDEILLERVLFDRVEYERLIDKARAIIASPEPPTRLSDDPTWWECKFCPARAQCHQAEPTAPPANCRTCAHSTPDADGAWKCEHYGQPIPLEVQRGGCDEHRFIPTLVPWLTIEEVGPGNAVTWRNATNGVRIEQPAYSSHEIHAASDKKFLGDPFVAMVKTTFGVESRVVSDTPETMCWQTFADGSRHVRVERGGLFVRWAEQTPDVLDALTALGNPEFIENGSGPQSDLEMFYEPDHAGSGTGGTAGEAADARGRRGAVRDVPEREGTRVHAGGGSAAA